MMFRRAVLAICLASAPLGVTARAGAGTVGENMLPAMQASASQTADAQAGQQAYHLPPEKLAKAIALGRIRNFLGFAYPVWDLVVLWSLLASGVTVRLDAWSRRVSERPAIHGLLFFSTLIVLLNVADLPLNCFSHSVSISYGISVQGWGSWLGDHAKALGLTLMLGTPLMLLLFWIVRRSPQWYWLWAWLIVLPLGVFVTFVEPLGEPLFYEFAPLAKSNPGLVNELEKVVARTGTSIPANRMFLMKASAKTNGLNAYVTGLGATKRIVVWDNTVGKIPDDEILFIFAHESGHYVLNHVLKGLGAAVIGFFFVFWASALTANWLVRRFGARWRVESVGSMAGFLVLLLTASAASFLTEPIGNAFSRHIEHEADVYGQEAVHGIVVNPQKTGVNAMNHLGEAWLEEPNPSPFIEFWSYSHPSTQHRAEFAARYDPWANGGRGEFFEK